jgi:hypothetical protein
MLEMVRSSFRTTQFLNATLAVLTPLHATLTAMQMLKTTHAFTPTDASTRSLATSTRTQTATTVHVPTPVATMRQHATTILTRHVTTDHASLLLIVQAFAAETSSKTPAVTATMPTIKAVLSNSTSLVQSKTGLFLQV